MSHECLADTAIPVFRSVESLRAWRKPHQLNKQVVGLVPTMGALHQGHISLIRLAARECHHVVVSVFVNPAQFGINEDLASYPVTWAADASQLAGLDRELADLDSNFGRISAVFAPSTRDMYPSGFPGQEPHSTGSFVTITPVGQILEGASRPTFFRGVATVCMKLFNAVQPERAYFGQKDVQQTIIIRSMVRDFLVPVQIVVGPTVREPDGLALSSRNVYLGTRRRLIAIVLRQALQAAERTYLAGETSAAPILAAAHAVVTQVARQQAALEPQRRVRFEVDYLAISDPDTMAELGTVDPVRGAILSGAIKMYPIEEPRAGEDVGYGGGPLVRLLDNIVIAPTKEEPVA